jgi:hypothetical protein
MRRFRVTVARQIRETQTIDVEAESYGNAAEVAIERAVKKAEWQRQEDEIELDSIFRHNDTC